MESNARHTAARIAAGVVLLVSLIIAVPDSMAAEETDRPRLVVLVVFDQLRGDYPIRWAPHFGEKGFRRLLRDGAWFQNCHYPYAGTLTGAGHASLMTGCSPATHGIVSNEWPNRANGALTNCVDSIRHERVPALPEGPAGGRGKVSPELLKAESFGDVLKDATAGKGRIVSISFKDRSAVLPAGHKADACYWFDNGTGTFVTSTYYTDQLHPWVETFNRERMADQWFDQPWTRFRNDLNYDELIGPDDVAGEGTGTKQGRTFPHPMNGGLGKPGPAYYQALYTSPFGNNLLLELAERAIDAENLGADDVPDMLCISFSSNDAVGHTWGPDSQEVFDTTLRSDVTMQKLLAYLDDKVGQGRYLLALSADHGICPIPEVAQTRGKTAGRLLTAQLQREANEFLEAELGGRNDAKPRWVAGIANNWVYFNTAYLQQRSVTLARAESVLADWLRKQSGISAVYTSTQLKAGLPDDDALGKQSARSYFPERCGDVFMVLSPHWLPGDYTTGTTHGSPHEYDTHVPLLVFGPRVDAGIKQQRISPLAIAAIFAEALGIKPPAQADTPLPKGVFK